MSIRSPRSLIQQIEYAHFEALMRRLGSQGPFPEPGSKTYVDAAMMLVLALGEGPRSDFDEILDRVAALGDDRGRHAILIAAGRRRETFDAAMDGHRGPADSALWCMLEHPDVFSQAETAFAGECARERAHEFVGSFMTDPAPSLALENLPIGALSAAFLDAYRARGDRCSEPLLYPEERTAPPSGGPRSIEITVYRKGRPQTEHVYEGDNPVHKRSIPVMPDTVVFQPERGLVEVISRHGDEHRTRLAAAFCDAALGREPPVRVERLGISFEPLRIPRKFEAVPAAGVSAVRLFELRVSNGRAGHETIRADTNEDVYECMRRRGTLHLLDGDIDRAAFEVFFGDRASNSRIRPLKLVLAGEDAISFPKWSPARQAIGRQLLEEWGLTLG